MIGALFLIGTLGLAIAATILQGWVLSLLWGWFIVPIFGLPSIGIAQALGISIIISLTTSQYIPTKGDDIWMPLCTMFAQPLFALLLGWIVRKYA